MDLKKKSLQPRSNLSENEKGYLIADIHGILNTRRKYSCLLLNANGVHNVRHNVSPR